MVFCLGNMFISLPIFQCPTFQITTVPQRKLHCCTFLKLLLIFFVTLPIASDVSCCPYVGCKMKASSLMRCQGDHRKLEKYQVSRISNV